MRAQILALDAEISRLGQIFDRNIAEGGRSVWADSVDDRFVGEARAELGARQRQGARSIRRATTAAARLRPPIRTTSHSCAMRRTTRCARPCSWRT